MRQVTLLVVSAWQHEALQGAPPRQDVPLLLAPVLQTGQLAHALSYRIIIGTAGAMIAEICANIALCPCNGMLNRLAAPPLCSIISKIFTLYNCTYRQEIGCVRRDLLMLLLVGLLQSQNNKNQKINSHSIYP